MNKITTGIIGALAGMAAGMLLAPKTGKETRRDIQATYHKLPGVVANRIGKLKGHTKAKFSEAVNDVLAEFKENEEMTKEEIIERLKQRLS